MNLLSWFKKRNNQIIAGVVVLVLLVAGGFFFISKSKNKSQSVVQDQTVQSISAEEIGLDLEVSPDQKKVKFIIGKTKDFKTVEYEILYEADAPPEVLSEGGEEKIQRGFNGTVEIKSGMDRYESEFEDLGSCSRNVCKYDTGIESISITLKIIKTDGKIYSAEKSIELK